jgi:hypothetical protein
MGRIAETNPLRCNLGLEIVLELVAASEAALEGAAGIAVDDLFVVMTRKPAKIEERFPIHLPPHPKMEQEPIRS